MVGMQSTLPRHFHVLVVIGSKSRGTRYTVTFSIIVPLFRQVHRSFSKKKWNSWTLRQAQGCKAVEIGWIELCRFSSFLDARRFQRQRKLDVLKIRDASVLKLRTLAPHAPFLGEKGAQAFIGSRHSRKRCNFKTPQ